MIGSRTKRSAALVAGGALLWLAPISASALGISIVNVSSSGGNTAYLSNNDILTLDLVVENATNEDVYGLGLGIAGYDIGNDGNVNNDALRFIGGSVAISALNTSLETDPELVGIGGLGPSHARLRRGRDGCGLGHVVSARRGLAPVIAFRVHAYEARSLSTPIGSPSTRRLRVRDT